MRTLVVHMSGLGDLVVCLPALHVISEAAGTDGVTFAADADYRQLIRMEGLPCELVDLAALPWRALWDRSLDAAAAGIPRYELVTELWHLGARRLRYEAATGGRYLVWPPDPGTWRQGDMPVRTWAWARAALHTPAKFVAPRLRPSAITVTEVAAYLAGRDIHPPYAVVAPGAGGEYKAWPEAHWWALARRLRTEAGVQVVVILGPRECGRGVVAPADAADYVVREWELEDVAAVLARASLYVGNDSGLSHVAAWVQTGQDGRLPCVLAFCRLNMRTWAANVPWMRALALDCAHPDRLTVGEMYGAAAAALAGQPGPASGA